MSRSNGTITIAEGTQIRLARIFHRFIVKPYCAKARVSVKVGFSTQSLPTETRTRRMTECHSNPIGFAGVGRRKIVADFDGGRLTTDAGILLLREVDRRIGLVDAISDCLPDPRDPRYTTHEQREMIAQRIFSIAASFHRSSQRRPQRSANASRRRRRCNWPPASRPKKTSRSLRRRRSVDWKIASVARR